MPNFAFPKVLPFNWEQLRESDDGRMYLVAKQISVICSVAVEKDGLNWVHISCARQNRLPDWDDLRTIKDFLLGKDGWAVQVLPPESEYYNVHPYCLHLWQCLDKRVVPDFRKEGHV